MIVSTEANMKLAHLDPVRPWLLAACRHISRHLADCSSDVLVTPQS
jgi:hypothetical protein